MRALIFDLDGVLVSTDAFHYQAWKQLTDRLKIEFDETVNNRLRGISRMESLEIILEQYHGAPFSYTEKCMLADEKTEYTESCWRQCGRRMYQRKYGRHSENYAGAA